eukprot:scaffold70391_cov66-Phaeocystis_antarctica.AAC.4
MLNQTVSDSCEKRKINGPTGQATAPTYQRPCTFPHAVPKPPSISEQSRPRCSASIPSYGGR